MANFKSNMCQVNTGYRPPISSAQAGEVKAVRGWATLPDSLAIGDIVELVSLPADHVIVDAILDSSDIDSGSALVMDVGIVNSGGTDLEANTTIISATTVGQTGGIARMDEHQGPRIAATQTNRNVGAKITTDAATNVEGVIGLTLFYRAANAGE